MTLIACFVPAYGDSLNSQLPHSLLHDYAFCARSGFEYRYFAHDIQPVDRARNSGVDRARTMGATHLMMYDADVFCDPTQSPLEHLYGLLEEHNATHEVKAVAVSAVTVLRSGDRLNVEPVRFGEVYPCDRVGAAVMLIDLRRLDALAPEHVWFRYEVAVNGIDAHRGEDLYFCSEVKRLGGLVLAAYTIPTRHIAKVPLAVERFRPS